MQAMTPAFKKMLRKLGDKVERKSFTLTVQHVSSLISGKGLPCLEFMTLLMKRLKMWFIRVVRVVLHLHHHLRQGFGHLRVKLGGYHVCWPCRDPGEEEQVRSVAPAIFFDVTAPCRLKSLTADPALFGHGVFDP